MVMEGVPPAMIENAAKMAGMPVGPLALNDEVGIDLSLRILQAAKEGSGRQRYQSGAREAHRSDGVEGRPLRPQERQGVLRLSGKRIEELVAGTSEDCGQATRSRHHQCQGPQGSLPLHCGARGRPLHGRGHRHRSARSRRRFDPRLWLSRHILAALCPSSTAWGSAPLLRAPKSSRPNTVPNLSLAKSSSGWPSTARPSTALTETSARRRSASTRQPRC